MPHPLSVLVIDDEIAVLDVMEGLMSHSGIAVDTAAGGEEGCEKLKANAYHMVITDLKMPGISGREILDQVRRIRGEDLPVVAMSGTPWLAGDSSFDAVLAKPFGRKTLFELIQTLFPGFNG